MSKESLMILILQSIILGIIQGLTEFIPISSSAHLVVIPWLFNWDNPALTSLTFDVALHLGTLIAILFFFASDWVKIIGAGILSIIERDVKKDFNRKLAWFLVVGSIPGGIAGFLLESKMDKMFHAAPINPYAMIIMGLIIAVMGGLLFLADKAAEHAKKMNQLGFKDSLLIGLAQALAIFPGVSRSGSTITAGLALGLEREAAARFSFLLAAPIIAGAGLKSVLDFSKMIYTGAISQAEMLLFPIGLVTAAVSGFFCIKLLLRFLQKNSTKVFVYYRWGLAALIIIIALVRR
jgi:undecaprenyl-diphosphatase